MGYTKAQSERMGEERGEERPKEYEDLTVKLGISKEYLRKLDDVLIGKKRIFSSRAEAFRRSLELLFEKYDEVLRDT